MGMVRYILALGVVVAHFNTLAGKNYWCPISSADCVEGFFALSGFLLFGSFLKVGSFKLFFFRRMRRLLPAYFTVVLLGAFLCVFLSTLSCSRYFTDSQFYQYLLSNLAFMNFLQPALPGVFDNNIMHAVNGSLWTMKVEVLLALTVPVVAWIIRKFKVKPIAVFLAIYIFSACYKIFFLYLFDITGSKIFEILSRQFLGEMMFFYAGVMVYFYFNSFVKYKWHIALVCVLLMLISQSFNTLSFFLRPISLTSIVLLFSMVGRWGTWEGKRDNVSYNIYLVHFPLIQAYVALGFSNSGILGFAALTGVIIIVSIIINQLVEKPCHRIDYKPRLPHRRP